MNLPSLPIPKRFCVYPDEKAGRKYPLVDLSQVTPQGSLSRIRQLELTLNDPGCPNAAIMDPTAFNLRHSGTGSLVWNDSSNQAIRFVVISMVASASLDAVDVQLWKRFISLLLSNVTGRRVVAGLVRALEVSERFVLDTLGGALLMATYSKLLQCLCYLNVSSYYLDEKTQFPASPSKASRAGATSRKGAITQDTESTDSEDEGQENHPPPQQKLDWTGVRESFSPINRCQKSSRAKSYIASTYAAGTTSLCIPQFVSSLI